MQEFVNEVVNGVRERLSDCEVMVAIKDMPNGLTKTGITIKLNGANIAPTIYVDDFYKSNLPVKDTIDTIVRIYHDHKIPSIDMKWFMDFEQIRPYLRARLYNKSTKAEVFKSAGEYGFDDLIIVPYVDEVDIGAEQKGSIKVMSQHLEMWNRSADEVIEIALGNTARLGKISSMAKWLSKMMDVPENFISDEPDFIKIASVQNQAFGAISAITCRSQLTEMYPDGYYIIPSSIHECIVLPVIDEFGYITEMIKTVNREVVSPEEILSDHVYKFV